MVYIYGPICVEEKYGGAVPKKRSKGVCKKAGPYEGGGVCWVRTNPPSSTCGKQNSEPNHFVAVLDLIEGSELEAVLHFVMTFEASSKITAPIAAMIALQGKDPMSASIESKAIKSSVRNTKRDNQLAEADAIFNELPPPQQRLLACTREKGASSWLSALPIGEHRFFLHKGDFRDALCLRYGWQISNLPLHCVCGDPLSVDHAMCCHKGGFPTLRHNEIRDMSANLLREVCPNTCTKPGLQPLNSETFQLRTANTDNEARVDIRAEGFWTSAQVAFFDIRVFHPSAPSYRKKELSAVYRLHENAKKREYGARIREVERGAFTPLVLSTTGGMARECTVFYKRLADRLANKRKTNYSLVMTWLRCRISFALLRSAIRALRGSRSSTTAPAPVDIPLVTSESFIH